MFGLAAEGFGLVGMRWDRLAAALGSYAYVARYGLSNLRAELLSSRPAVVDLLVHVVALADNLDSALHRGDSRVAYVLRPLMTS